MLQLSDVTVLTRVICFSTLLVQISKKTVVCSSHFVQSDFKRTLTNRKVLKTSAVPTVFSWSIFISQLLACNHHQIAYIMLYTVSHVVIDHDYCQVVEQIPIEEQIESARQEIYRLNREIELIRCERFGVSRFMYDDALIRFYTGFSSVRLFRSFIELLRPVKQNMKTWSQVQRARSKMR